MYKLLKNDAYNTRSVQITFHTNNYTATILLGSTFTRMNMVSSFMKWRFFNISWETNFGKPNPKESGSRLGRWKFFHVGSGMKLSTILQAFSGHVDWSKSVKDTEWEKGQRSKASYSPGRILMYTEIWVSSPAPLPLGNREACNKNICYQISSFLIW